MLMSLSSACGIARLQPGAHHRARLADACRAPRGPRMRAGRFGQLPRRVASPAGRCRRRSGRPASRARRPWLELRPCARLSCSTRSCRCVAGAVEPLTPRRRSALLARDLLGLLPRILDVALGAAASAFCCSRRCASCSRSSAAEACAARRRIAVGRRLPHRVGRLAQLPRGLRRARRGCSSRDSCSSRRAASSTCSASARCCCRRRRRRPAARPCARRRCRSASCSCRRASSFSFSISSSTF